jgi:hexokinase
MEKKPERRKKPALKCFPSYIGKPTGKEQGTFMTIDNGWY